MSRRGAAFVVAVVLSVGVVAAARADGGWVHEVRDARGRLVAVVPRQSTTIALRREAVAIIPCLLGGSADAVERLRLFVNVRYLFANAGAAGDLRVGFPELKARVTETDQAPNREASHAAATIEAFAADVGGRPLVVTPGPGTGDYARWFTFTVPFPSGERALRNQYLARPGSRRVEAQDGGKHEYHAEYILHTGSQWKGPIEQGEVVVWDGGPVAVRRFTNLRPARKDDVKAALRVTVQPGRGRPILVWDLRGGNAIDDPPRLEVSSVVGQRTARALGGGLFALGAMALDGDPDTAWIDDGATGGVGEWLQIPTFRLGRLRGLVVRAGVTAAGVVRIRRMRVACLDLQGNAREAKELESEVLDLRDEAGEQRVVLLRPLGACHAVRLTIEALHGPVGSHGTLAEVAFIE
jgi:hypothetical protein